MLEQADRIRRRTPGYAFVILLLIAALVATAFLWARPDPGPLEPPLGRSRVGVTAQLGQTVTAAAMDLVAYRGEGRVVLDSVEAVDVTPGIGVVGYLVLLPHAAGTIESAAEWPPAGYDVREVQGFTYRALSTQPQIIVGLKALSDGRSSIAGFRLRYRVGGAEYVVSYAQQIDVCVPSC